MLRNFFFLFCLSAFFLGGLGSYPLLNNNEGLYAEIAWEMVETGNWVIPHLNGVPYIEKPPLLYWLVALSFKILGKSEFSARLVPALFGFLTSCSLYFFGQSFQKEAWGKYAAIILTTSCGFIVFSHMVFFDVALTFFLTASALSFYKFYQTERKKYLYAFSILMAAAVLTKGFVAIFLIGIFFLSFLALEKNTSFLKCFLNPWVWTIFLLLTVPWHVMASLQDSNFPWFYFVNEHWMRFLDKRIPKDYYTGPFYYYIPRVLGYMVPWTFMVPFFIKKQSALNNSLKRFLRCWFFSFLLFFSFSRAKANYYMVVGIPPLSLWLGAYLSTASRRVTLSLSAAIFSGFMMIIGVLYIQQKEDLFSVRKSFQTIPQNSSIYLYKAFEELSSLSFYVGHPIPIIETNSQDLWYGQQITSRKDLFLSSLIKEENQEKILYVLRKDEKEFLEKYADKNPKIIYTSRNYSVFII